MSIQREIYEFKIKEFKIMNRLITLFINKYYINLFGKSIITKYLII